MSNALPNKLHALQQGIYYASAPLELLTGRRQECEDVPDPVLLLGVNLTVSKGQHASSANRAEIKIDLCTANCHFSPLSKPQENQLCIFNLSKRHAAYYTLWKVYLLVG